jgi:hypothetical protein
LLLGVDRSRALKLAALKSKESCQGKSKFFLEHQVLWEKEGNRGYDTNVHGWRYAEQVPLPEGPWPISKLVRMTRRPRDEHQKEEAAKWHRLENRLLREELRQQELIKEELRRQQKRLASQQEYFASGRNNLPSRDDQGHVSNVQMAVQFFNNKNPGSKYELKEIYVDNTFTDFESVYCHYNFAAYSPTYGFQLFFAEVDILGTNDVLQCCAVGSEPHGMSRIVLFFLLSYICRALLSPL